MFFGLLMANKESFLEGNDKQNKVIADATDIKICEKLFAPYTENNIRTLR